jgi:hypothetical protein
VLLVIRVIGLLGLLAVLELLGFLGCGFVVLRIMRVIGVSYGHNSYLGY